MKDRTSEVSAFRAAAAPGTTFFKHFNSLNIFSYNDLRKLVLRSRSLLRLFFG